MASPPLRYNVVFWFSLQAAIALIHVLITYHDPNPQCWGELDDSPADSGSRIMCTLQANCVGALVQSYFILAAAWSTTDSRCRNCVSAVRYHQQFFYWVLMLFMLWGKSRILTMHGNRQVLTPTLIACEDMILGRFGPTAYLAIVLPLRIAAYHYAVSHIYSGGVDSLGSYGALWRHWFLRRLVWIAQLPFAILNYIERAEQNMSKSAETEAAQRHDRVCLSTPAATGVCPVVVHYEAANVVAVGYLLPTHYQPALVVHTL